MSEASLTQDIFIGVDGGATKTIVRAENARSEPLGAGPRGARKHPAIGRRQLAVYQ